MMQSQKHFQESLGYNFESMTDEERIDFIKNMTLALGDELHEALGEVGWKPWATSRHINREAYRGELVDAWHFFMNLLIVVGVTAEELEQKYYAKLNKNYKRQKEGYDGVAGKCPGCKRAYDDEAVFCYSKPGERLKLSEGHFQERFTVQGYCAKLGDWV